MNTILLLALNLLLRHKNVLRLNYMGLQVNLNYTEMSICLYSPFCTFPLKPIEDCWLRCRFWRLAPLMMNIWHSPADFPLFSLGWHFCN